MIGQERSAIMAAVCAKYRANLTYEQIQQQLETEFGQSRSKRTIATYIKAGCTVLDKSRHAAAIRASKTGRPCIRPTTVTEDRSVRLAICLSTMSTDQETATVPVSELNTVGRMWIKDKKMIRKMASDLEADIESKDQTIARIKENLATTQIARRLRGIQAFLQTR